MKVLPFAFAVVLLASSASASVPQGSFGGSSPLLGGSDAMAMLIRQDPADAKAGYALLAEYTRIPYITKFSPERLKITKWVPRMYAYRVEQIDDTRFAVKPLHVVAGEIVVDTGYAFGILTLKKKGSMIDAVLTRFEKGSATVAETVTFDGKVSSTWEAWVPGNYFGTKDNTGNDYLRKDVNTVLGADKTARFDQREIVGNFTAAEKAPGMFVFTPAGAGVVGADKVADRIGVFVDIVNWKPFFTTDELLLINPNDAKDLGFYYERH